MISVSHHGFPAASPKIDQIWIDLVCTSLATFTFTVKRICEKGVHKTRFSHSDFESSRKSEGTVSVEYGHSDAIPGTRGKPKRPQDRLFKILKDISRATEWTRAPAPRPHAPRRDKHFCPVTRHRSLKDRVRKDVRGNGRWGYVNLYSARHTGPRGHYTCGCGLREHLCESAVCAGPGRNAHSNPVCIVLFFVRCLNEGHWGTARYCQHFQQTNKFRINALVIIIIRSREKATRRVSEARNGEISEKQVESTPENENACAQPRKDAFAKGVDFIVHDIDRSA